MNRAHSSSRSEDRDAFLAAIGLVAPGNGLVILDASDSGAKAPAPKRLADAIAAAGGKVRGFKSPREGALAGWIEAEARERGPGPRARAQRRRLAERVGGFVREADAERAYQTRIASMELDKLALYRGDAPIEADDVRALVAEAVPSSVWAFTDAVGERRARRRSAGSIACSRTRRSRSSSRSSIGAIRELHRDRRPARRTASGCPPPARRWA